jgi:hypothetical protein
VNPRGAAAAAFRDQFARNLNPDNLRCATFVAVWSRHAVKD